MSKPEAEDRETAERIVGCTCDPVHSRTAHEDECPTTKVAAALSVLRAQMQREVETAEQDAEHFNRLAFVDPGALHPVTWKERAATAEAALERARQTVTFFASVIKSGEPWTQACEDEKRAALEPQSKTEKKP